MNARHQSARGNSAGGLAQNGLDIQPQYSTGYPVLQIGGPTAWAVGDLLYGIRRELAAAGLLDPTVAGCLERGLAAMAQAVYLSPVDLAAMGVAG